MYCKRRYFRVYKIPRICQKVQFRMYLNLWISEILHFISILYKFSLCIYFHGFCISAKFAKICTGQKYLGLQYTFYFNFFIRSSLRYRMIFPDQFLVNLYMFSDHSLQNWRGPLGGVWMGGSHFPCRF